MSEIHYNTQLTNQLQNILTLNNDLKNSDLDNSISTELQQVANMVEQPVAAALKAGFDMLFVRDAKEKVDLFSCTNPKFHINNFLKQAERIATENGWSDADKLRIFKT